MLLLPVFNKKQFKDCIKVSVNNKQFLNKMSFTDTRARAHILFEHNLSIMLRPQQVRRPLTCMTDMKVIAKEGTNP